ncbi:uncharacterized protein si:ch211-189a15.5 [Osmerus eperlanus]|uniref:uncharacterized protein si:ch211-189a15.5 n=1 Tax=Osmerus eperlanus TaxID=29151 RepID=UPI002E14EBEC
MTNRGPDQTPDDRHIVFEEYQEYYILTGSPEVCKETPVTEKAVRFLSDSDPAGRFRTVDFYHIASECSKIGSRDCRSVLAALIKATEMLEVLCVNMFLYPWKKEIKSLKTYTGAFVYCLKAVLPLSITQAILATVGYQPQSDTQYVLADSVDPEKVIQVGFDLFLARMECEHLLQVMGQSPQPECLEILRRRGTSPSITGPEEPASGRAEREKQENEEEVVEGELCTGCPLVAPGPQENEENQMNSPGRPEVGLPLEAASKPPTQSPSPGLRPSSTALNEDRFHLEMQCNYPDLAIRQKRIFSKIPRPPAAQSIREKQQADEPGRATSGLASHLVGPQYTLHTAATEIPPTQPLSQNPLPRPTPQWDLRSRGEQEGPEKQGGLEAGSEAKTEAWTEAGEEEEVRLLAERMGQMYVCKENLGYPIEETGTPDPHPDKGSNRRPAPPMLCHPSLVPVCHIPGCNSCGGGMDNLREPPHSVYVPACHLELCDPSQNQSRETKSLRVQMEYSAVVGPRAQLQHAMEGPSVEVQHQAVVGPRVQQHRSPTQQPEDDLLQTYVMVEHDKK